MKPFLQKTILENSAAKDELLLREEFGNNKEFARSCALPSLVALSFYPSLRDITVEFRFVKSNHLFFTIVKPSTIHKPGAKRIYYVNISTEIKKEREPLLFRNLNFNMQVGVIAHELAHVTDYMEKSFLQILSIAVLYNSNRYKQKLEKSMDLKTIQQGAGYQLLEYSRYVKHLQPKHLNDKYYKTYFDYYLSTAEIEYEIDSLPIYKDKETAPH